MSNPIKTVVRDYGWIHLSLGLFGNVMFFVGSILFLPTFEPVQTIGVWLFIFGSGLMMIGAIGQLLVKLYEKPRKERGHRP